MKRAPRDELLCDKLKRSIVSVRNDDRTRVKCYNHKLSRQ